MDYIQNHNRDVTTSKVETQNIYQKIILKGSKEHKITGEIQWKKLIPNIQFKNIWKNTYNSYGQHFQKDIHYRLLHYSTKTNHYMHKYSKENNPNCDYCRLLEDNLHLFTKCSRIQQIWTQYQPVLTKLIGKTYTPTQHLLTLNVENVNKETKKLTLTIIQIILYEIWETRNNLKYDDITLTAKTIINKINK